MIDPNNYIRFQFQVAFFIVKLSISYRRVAMRREWGSEAIQQQKRGRSDNSYVGEPQLVNTTPSMFNTSFHDTSGGDVKMASVRTTARSVLRSLASNFPGFASYCIICR
jgi:hypothetical protein